MYLYRSAGGGLYFNNLDTGRVLLLLGINLGELLRYADLKTTRQLSKLANIKIVPKTERSEQVKCY